MTKPSFGGPGAKSSTKQAFVGIRLSSFKICPLINSLAFESMLTVLFDRNQYNSVPTVVFFLILEQKYLVTHVN